MARAGRSWTGLLCLALAACGGSTDPDEGDLLATIDYASRGADGGALPPPDYQGRAAVSVVGNTLRFDTTMYGDLCRTSPTAHVREVGGQVILTLRLEVNSEALCPQSISETDVVAHTLALQPGQYTTSVRIKYWVGPVQVLDAGAVTIE